MAGKNFLYVLVTAWDYITGPLLLMQKVEDDIKLGRSEIKKLYVSLISNLTERGYPNTITI